MQLAQPIRLLLEYAGADYKDVQYACGPAPKFDLSPWLNVKNTLGLDYPNLPYLIDGHIKITQSNAILRYLGRKFDLDGKAEEDRVQVDIMLDNAMDFLGKRPWMELLTTLEGEESCSKVGLT